MENPLLKTVLIYENFAAGVSASWFCQSLAWALDCVLQEQLWNFDVLEIREVRNDAATAAKQADLVIVSVSGRTELPGSVRACLDIWLQLLDDEHPALVAFFNTAASPKMPSIRAYLSTIAERARIAFFLHKKVTAAGNSGFR